MPNVMHDEIPLDDDRAIRAIIKRLALPRLEGTWLEVGRFGRPLDQLAFWERYMLERRTYFVWRDKADVWITAHADAGVLRRVVIFGLTDKKDAEALRSSAWRLRAEKQQTPTIHQIERLAEQVMEGREERIYQEHFRRYLRDVRHYFRWQDGEVIEGPGRLLPISKLGLREDHLDLLRQVYAALPLTSFSPTGEDPSSVDLTDEPCPLCGGRAKADAKTPTPLKERKASRRDVADAATKNIAKGDFMLWVNSRLTDEDTGVWTHTRELFQDYERWLAKRQDDDTVKSHAESKAASMSMTMWGTLMGQMYTKRRNGRGKDRGFLYGVRLRKR